MKIPSNYHWCLRDRKHKGFYIFKDTCREYQKTHRCPKKCPNRVKEE